MRTSAPSARRCWIFSRDILSGTTRIEAVALRDADLRQAEAGIAGGRLDDGAAGRQPAVALGGLDHRQRDAVLDRAAGILAFELEEQPAGAGVELGELDDRRLADQVEHGGNRLAQVFHRRSLGFLAAPAAVAATASDLPDTRSGASGSSRPWAAASAAARRLHRRFLGRHLRALLAPRHPLEVFRKSARRALRS